VKAGAPFKVQNKKLKEYPGWIALQSKGANNAEFKIFEILNPCFLFWDLNFKF
jgi:hypothetical protein